jgi:hypothetical protein
VAADALGRRHQRSREVAAVLALGHEHDLPLTSVDAYGQRTAKTTAAGRVPRVIEQIRTRGLATSPPWSRVRSSRCAALWGGRPEEYAASVAAGSVIAPAHR